MALNYKGKVYRNIQEQVGKNKEDIEDLLTRVEALEEAILPTAKDLYLHIIQIRDEQLVADSLILVNFIILTDNNNEIDETALEQYLVNNDLTSDKRFIPAVGVTDVDSFTALGPESTYVTIDRTIIGVFATEEDGLYLIELVNDEDESPKYVARHYTVDLHIEDTNIIKIL